MTEKPHHALGVTGYGFGMAFRGRRQERTAAPQRAGARGRPRALRVRRDLSVGTRE